MKCVGKLSFPLLAAMCLWACDDPGANPDFEGPAVTINVAPLTLDSVTNAEYSLTVSTAADTVWTAVVNADEFGNGAGSLSYVGPCDASAGANTVTVELLQLFSDSGATTVVDPATYQNPGPLSQIVNCVENSDVFVTFNITILRGANQGFFDIAVNFDDIFCSAKFDCVRDGGPINLLFNDAGDRDQTLVLGFACTGGDDANATTLYMDNLQLDCDAASATVNPDAGEGNLSDGAGITQDALSPLLFAAAVYRGKEQLGFDKLYWNVALGWLPPTATPISPVNGTARVSIHTDGTEGDARSLNISLSDDGSVAAFDSVATTLIDSDVVGGIESFVRIGGITQLINVDDAGNQGNSVSGLPKVSGDGRFVAFLSLASDLVPVDTNANQDIFVRDLQLNTTTLVSVTTAGAQSTTGFSTFPDIDGDGDRIVFVQSNGGFEGGSGPQHVYLRDRGDLTIGTDDTLSLLSVNTSGNPGTGGNSNYPVISGNGQVVAFISQASDLVVTDANGTNGDIFVRDIATSTTTIVNIDDTGAQPNFGGFRPSLSANGELIAFRSRARMITGDSSSGDKCYVRDLTKAPTDIGAYQRIDVDSAGNPPAFADCDDPELSADGTSVVFSSSATSLVTGDTNGVVDIFRHNLITGETVRVNVTLQGQQLTVASEKPSVSGDGRFVAFETESALVVVNDTNAVNDVFVRDMSIPLENGTAISNLNCQLTTQGTASAGPLTNSQTPDGTAYPVIVWNVPLTDDAGALICGAHAVNAGAEVATEYTPADTQATFDHEYTGSGAP